MELKTAKNLLLTIKKFKYRFEPKALVLVYHRISDPPCDPLLLSVNKKNFCGHLEVLKKYYRPIYLEELNIYFKKGRIPNKAVIITFDDGYCDNLYNAMPFLNRYGIPATIFVTTGYMDKQREYWWDKLGRLFLQSPILPRELNFSINGDRFYWKLDKDACYSNDEISNMSSWNVLEKNEFNIRQSLYRWFYKLLLCSPEYTRSKVMTELEQWSGIKTTDLSLGRSLSPEEVIRFSSNNLITIGAHTVTHPLLSACPLSIQKDEIYNSKYRLEQLLQKPINSFCYPYGTKSDYSIETVDIVKKAGFSLACSNFSGMVTQDTDCFQLPRFIVRNWDAEEFKKRLKRFFNSNYRT